jgi:hypothetical protein
VFEMLPAFSCISWACALCAGVDASIILSGSAEAEGGTSVFFGGLAFLESDGAWSPWQRTIYIITALGLNRAARIVVQKEGESSPNT